MIVGLFAKGTAAAVASSMLTLAEEWTLFFLPSFLTLQRMDAAPSWHPGGTDSPASLQKKGGKRGKKRRREGRMGGQKRGRDESKQHQRDNVTFLRAQGLLIRGSFAQGVEREASREGRWRKRPTGLLFSRKDRGHQALRG